MWLGSQMMGQIRVAAVQLDGDMPHRCIPVNLLVDAGESAVNGTKACDTCAIDTFQCTYPQFQVWVYRVLDQYRNVGSFQRIGKFLHGKGVGRSARANP